MAALALTSLIFGIAVVCLGRVAVSYSHVTLRHDQANALFLAEAGVRAAGQRLLRNPNYTGEKAELLTGSFDVTVSRAGSSYAVTSVGKANSPLRPKPTRIVRAVVTLVGAGGFHVSNWREN